MGAVGAPEPLGDEHDLSQFCSGEPALDEWLRRRALRNEEAGACRTYVVCAGTRVVAFYSLATGAIAQTQATGRVRRNMPDPVPVVVLGRLAVDQEWQGRGVARGLLRDATLRTLQASQAVGVRAIVVHAKSEDARRFYVERCGLSPSPLDAMTLMITLADARAILLR